MSIMTLWVFNDKNDASMLSSISPSFRLIWFNGQIDTIIVHGIWYSRANQKLSVNKCRLIHHPFDVF
jgi:hypothetical protein